MDGVNLLVVKRGDLIGMYAQRIFIQYGLGWSCNSGFTLMIMWPLNGGGMMIALQKIEGTTLF